MVLGNRIGLADVMPVILANRIGRNKTLPVLFRPGAVGAGNAQDDFCRGHQQAYRNRCNEKNILNVFFFRGKRWNGHDSPNVAGCLQLMKQIQKPGLACHQASCRSISNTTKPVIQFYNSTTVFKCVNFSLALTRDPTAWPHADRRQWQWQWTPDCNSILQSGKLASTADRAPTRRTMRIAWPDIIGLQH